MLPDVSPAPVQSSCEPRRPLWWRRELDGDLGARLIRVEPPESLSLGQVQRGSSTRKEARIVNPSSDDPVTIRIDASPSGGPFRWSAV